MASAAACLRSSDPSSYNAWLLLANAYADLGTYYGFTPYVGAGIGGARVNWDDLHNTVGGTPPFTPVPKTGALPGPHGRYVLLPDRQLKLDVGYRYTSVDGGRMFELASIIGGAGPGFDDGFNVHEARAGLRYDFGATQAAPRRSRSPTSRSRSTNKPLAQTSKPGTARRNAGRFSFGRRTVPSDEKNQTTLLCLTGT